ncbi:cobalamin (vitamin B12) biosynthesis CbiX protein [Mycobacteroides abscessus subsp. abscessus]|uniref:sirohydrochlorin chelatase n=1 Tax=Mycobacteroides abscessus TaxID=36809 RepID=UPI0002DEF099|nr:sirohydrochlorin chelatase [Mycobacteroides abscessus]MBN7532476.1 sirohydrochlorin chelatase [Mycobacteroides abscessus subsp. abscessus]MDO2970563.1 sirohydrochlorin chelatase [Mycobacteroides abscessus subsp. bolletii]MDO3077948.1 sirohydrochlorin chelatase [Mycobacteroides abscessus subsp. bolletii]MDO3103648.1 sirohydrochlorin chelatase [Mycobacteroides abscessus subsp. abscessus]PVA84488.1 sirohydrochlorin chelatase [Mycobacteroides abscessus]
MDDDLCVRGSSAAELVLVAHGTRSAAGVENIAALAEAVSRRVGSVRTAFVDVMGPTPSEVLAMVGGPTVLLPAFLASGYHVHQDIPQHIELSGHPEVAVAQTLGPDPVLATVMAERLREAGWRRSDAVVLAAAGSSDPRARHEVHTAASMLARRTGPVKVGYIATGEPRVRDVVAELRGTGRRVFVASYLLAHGMFQQRLAEAGADGVAQPLGVHPEIVNLMVRRFASAAVVADGLEAVADIA